MEGVKCPRCNVYIQLDRIVGELLGADGLGTVVGQSNAPKPDDEFTREVVFDCPYCNGYPRALKLSLAPIAYNANHGIHYPDPPNYGKKAGNEVSAASDC